MTSKEALRVLKAFIRDKYGLKVVATKGFWKKYYVLDFTSDTWSPITGDKRLANKLFDNIADIIEALKGN